MGGRWEDEAVLWWIGAAIIAIAVIAGIVLWPLEDEAVLWWIGAAIIAIAVAR